MTPWLTRSPRGNRFVVRRLPGSWVVALRRNGMPLIWSDGRIVESASWGVTLHYAAQLEAQAREDAPAAAGGWVAPQ